MNNKQMLYREYLKSKDWKKLKEEKSKCSKKRCSICSDTKEIHLHHLFYRSSLDDTKLSDLRWLCKRCHFLAHDLIKKKKIKIKNPTDHNSIFSSTKNVVKRELGLTHINLFQT